MPIGAFPAASCPLKVPFQHWHLFDHIVPVAIEEPDANVRRLKALYNQIVDGWDLDESLSISRQNASHE